MLQHLFENNEICTTFEPSTSFLNHVDNQNSDGNLEHISSIENLRKTAEHEFSKAFHKFPHFAVFAPGCFKIIGGVNDFNEGKTLCMAIQLFAVVVGSRRNFSNRCSIKFLSHKNKNSELHQFYLNTEGLFISNEDPSWLCHIKNTIKIFKVKKVYIPGFKIVIISNIPKNYGLGSNAALTVAMYTFLEAITGTHFMNCYEKAIACQTAQKNCLNEKEHVEFIGDTLISVLGSENKIVELDMRLLKVTKYNCDSSNFKWIIFKLPNFQTNVSPRQFMTQCKIISFAMKISSLRDARIEDLLKLNGFSEMLINRAIYVVRENDRVTQVANCIENNNWKKLGEILWNNNSSIQDNFGSLSNISFIMTTIKNTNGVLGIGLSKNGFNSCASILIEKHAVKNVLKVLTKLLNSKEYYILQSAQSASIIYAKQENVFKKVSKKNEGEKILDKYYLKTTNLSKKYYNFDSMEEDFIEKEINNFY